MNKEIEECMLKLRELKKEFHTISIEYDCLSKLLKEKHEIKWAIDDKIDKATKELWSAISKEL